MPSHGNQPEILACIVVDGALPRLAGMSLECCAVSYPDVRVLIAAAVAGGRVAFAYRGTNAHLASVTIVPVLLGLSVGSFSM